MHGTNIVIILTLLSLCSISFVFRSSLVNFSIENQLRSRALDHTATTEMETNREKNDKFDGRKGQVQEYDVCIVGAGLSGAVIAERYASQLQKE